MTCSHVYKLDPPDGEFSYGVCLRCGDEKSWPNHTPYHKNAWKKHLRRKPPEDPHQKKLDKEYVSRLVEN